MKVQTKAQIKTLDIDGTTREPASRNIDLEFSALDTGGGYKDPILDFSFPKEGLDIGEKADGEKHDIRLELCDPGNEENNAELLCEHKITPADERVNGRLKEEQLSRELIGFVLKLLR